MPVLIDYNQIFLSNVFAQFKDNFNQIDENLIRHTILNCTLSYKKQYSAKYGELIFCCDSHGDYWRKRIFPEYKANRKKAREQTGLNWHLVFSSLNKIREEIKNNMPYKVLWLENAEADDIIAVLTKQLVSQPILILSGDQDFLQLQMFNNVEQYSPIHKKIVKHNNPPVYLKEKILRGDVNDGIPNFLSDNDAFTNKDKRQKPLREKTLLEYLNRSIEQYEPQLKQNYERNRQLIDLLHCIPSEIEDAIVNLYNEQAPSRKNMMSYFMKNGLKLLTSSLTEF